MGRSEIMSNGDIPGNKALVTPDLNGKKEQKMTHAGKDQGRAKEKLNEQIKDQIEHYEEKMTEAMESGGTGPGPAGLYSPDIR